MSAGLLPVQGGEDRLRTAPFFLRPPCPASQPEPSKRSSRTYLTLQLHTRVEVAVTGWEESSDTGHRGDSGLRIHLHGHGQPKLFTRAVHQGGPDL